MNTRTEVLVSAAAVLAAFAAPSAMAQSRGELLYTTHCIACHTTEMHWRDQRVATDWTSLKFQVRRWQDAVSLGWSDADVLAVSRYLNQSIYHFEQTSDRVSSLSRLGDGPVSSPIVRPLPPSPSMVGGR
jgi:hypothetical protein